MRFLIRDIFLIMFFIAIGALYFASQRNLLVLTTQLASQEQENAAARFQLSYKVAERDFVQAEVDTSIQIEDVAKQIESHFPKFQAKYATIEPRGPTTVSLRQVPLMMDRETGTSLNRIRIHVPTERSLFLKYGIRSHKVQVRSQREKKRLRETPPPATGQGIGPDSDNKREMHIDYNDDGFTLHESSERDSSDEPGNDWQPITAYSEAGPFECRLQSGLTDIDWSNTLNEQGLWEMGLFMNQQMLLTTVLKLEFKLNSYTTLLAKEQRDFALGVPLPELFTSMRVNSKSTASSVFQIHVWLDEESSGFAAFPGAAELK